MSWNNRIFRHVTKFNGEDRVWYGLHECYYDAEGKPDGWTKEPVCGGFDTVDELIMSIGTMLNDSRRFRDQVLEYDKPVVQPSQERE